MRGMRIRSTCSNVRASIAGEVGMVISRRVIRVDWGDCDPAGIVFYPNYFRWFDANTTALFEMAGLSMPTLYRAHGLVGFPILDAGAKFVGSSRFGDELEAESSVAEWAEKTLKVQHRFRRGSTLLVDGYELRICAVPHPDDASRIKAAPIPPIVRERLGGASP
jgi:4-hydroxybenzoyl-CoA thioesterase